MYRMPAASVPTTRSRRSGVSDGKLLRMKPTMPYTSSSASTSMNTRTQMYRPMNELTCGVGWGELWGCQAGRRNGGQRPTAARTDSTSSAMVACTTVATVCTGDSAGGHAAPRSCSGQWLGLVVVVAAVCTTHDATMAACKSCLKLPPGTATVLATGPRQRPKRRVQKRSCHCQCVTPVS